MLPQGKSMWFCIACISKHTRKNNEQFLSENVLIPMKEPIPMWPLQRQSGKQASSKCYIFNIALLIEIKDSYAINLYLIYWNEFLKSLRDDALIFFSLQEITWCQCRTNMGLINLLPLVESGWLLLMRWLTNLDHLCHLWIDHRGEGTLV